MSEQNMEALKEGITMTISEKVAYLKGLAEGLGINDETKEGKVFGVMIDILEDLALDMEDLEQNSWELGEAIDQVSDDLEEVEEAVLEIIEDLDELEDYFDDDYDDDEDDDDFDCGCGCSETPLFFEVTCPACDNTITIDEDVYHLGAIECPNCGEDLEFVGIEGLDEDEDEEDD